MNDSLKEIPAPASTPSTLSPALAVTGPPIAPQQRILLYSPAEWEGFIHEWAHYCLKTKYAKVERFSGSGDMGIDIAAFVDEDGLFGIWDNYQCKHYVRVLRPTDAWPEIGKILWHTFKKEYGVPRRYFFVAPRGAGTALLRLLNDPEKLKLELIANWDKHARRNIGVTEVAMEGQFATYVQAFDFSIFDSKTGVHVTDEHRSCPLHAARFGGGLPARPTPGAPPTEIMPAESRYVEQLLAAYGDHKKASVPDVKTLKAWPKLNGHFGRQRESFYQAEALRVFARDTVPPGTFESLQNEIHSGVIDVCDGDHTDGYERVCSVTKAARDLQLTSNALVTCTKAKDRDGICHQLANEDRLRWTGS